MKVDKVVIMEKQMIELPYEFVRKSVAISLKEAWCNTILGTMVRPRIEVNTN